MKDGVSPPISHGRYTFTGWPIADPPLLFANVLATRGARGTLGRWAREGSSSGRGAAGPRSSARGNVHVHATCARRVACQSPTPCRRPPFSLDLVAVPLPDQPSRAVPCRELRQRRRRKGIAKIGWNVIGRGGPVRGSAWQCRRQASRKWLWLRGLTHPGRARATAWPQPGHSPRKGRVCVLATRADLPAFHARRKQRRICCITGYEIRHS